MYPLRALPQGHGKPHTAVVHVADEGEEDDLPEDHPEGEVLLEVPQEEYDKQGEPLLKDLDYPDDAVKGFGSE